MPTPITNIERGEHITKPSQIPTRSTHTFINWYKEAACTNLWNFAVDTVTQNTFLYAGWIANSSGNGWVEITLTWLDEENTFASIGSAPTTLSRRAGETLSLNVIGAGVNAVRFMVNGVSVGTSNPYTFSAATRVSGFYDLEAVIEKGGKYYSTGFRVRVID
jgi:hypothetical protein